MAYCSLKDPVIETKDGKTIEAPLYKELKRIVNPIEARMTYNDIISEEFKEQDFWVYFAVGDDYIDEYGQPTIEGLMKYTDFSTRVSLSHYADTLKEELLDNNLDINNTSDFKNALLKIREHNEKNKFYKAVLVRTTEKDKPFDLVVYKNSNKVFKLVSSIDTFLDNISEIETGEDVKDLFNIVKKHYTVYNTNINFNPNSVLETLSNIKEKKCDFDEFSQLVRNFNTSNLDKRIFKIISNDASFILKYLEDNELISEDSNITLETVESNINMYTGIVKNHLLYKAYKDMMLGDFIMNNENGEHLQNLVMRLNDSIVKEIDKINIPDSKQIMESNNEEVPNWSENTSHYFTLKTKESADSEIDIVRKIYFLEKDNQKRFDKLYPDSAYAGNRGVRNKINILNKIANDKATIEGLTEYITITLKELSDTYKSINTESDLVKKAKGIKMLIDKCTEYENIIEYFNAYIESNSFKNDVQEYIEYILKELKIDEPLSNINLDNINTILDNVDFGDEENKKNEYRKIFSDYFNQSFQIEGLKDLTITISRYKTSLINTSIEMSAEFLEKVQTEEGRTVAFGRNKGERIDILEKLKKADEDINVYNKLFSAMADCPDVILRLTDKAAKTEKGKARLETLEMIRQIKKEALLLEKAGVKGFSWLYKRKDGAKTGYYITKKDPEYKVIENNAAMKRFYDFFMEIKNNLDMMYPPSAVKENRIIGIRKDRLERLKNIKSFKGAVSGIVEGIKDNYIDREDDDDIAGYSELFVDASGNELKMLPVYYNNFEDSDAEHMSEDAVSTLIAYAAKAIEYKHLNDIISFIELEKIALRERKMPSTDGKLKVLNLFNRVAYKDDPSVREDNVIYHKDLGTSNAYKMFDAWVDMQFYGRWRQREGNIGKTNVSISKTVDVLNKKTAIASMSLNLLNGISNVMTGVSQTRIETILGTMGKGYVSMGDMTKADLTYSKELLSYLSEIGNRTKHSKLALFSEMFNISQEYEQDITEVEWQRDNWLKRFDANSALSFIQNGGEHYMAHRMAIAIAYHTKLLDKNGKETSLWDALKISYLQEDGSYGNEDKGLGAKLALNGEYTMNNKKFELDDETVYKLERKITGINQKIHGIYNKQDANVIQRYAMGRLVYMFRKWIPAAIDKRFMRTQYNYDTEEWKEGYYRTAFDFLKKLWEEREGLKFNTVLKFKELNDEQKSNVLRALIESLMFYLSLLIGKAIMPDDDDVKRQNWAYRMLYYQIIRLHSELAALTPVSLPYLNQNMLSEILKLFKSPIAAANTAQDSYSILGLLNPFAYMEEIKSGKYKGHSKAYKIIANNKFWNPIFPIYHKNSYPEEFAPWYK